MLTDLGLRRLEPQVRTVAPQKPLGGAAEELERDIEKPGSQLKA
jgi:hypothetical protein